MKNPKIKKIYKYYSLLEEESSQIIVSTISYSQMSVKPIPTIASTQSWHQEFNGFHFQIFFLKDDKVLAFLILAGIEFYITGPKYRIEPLPNLTELILGIQSFWGPFDLKPYNDSFNWNSSEKSGVERSFNALNISIAKLWYFAHE